MAEIVVAIVIEKSNCGKKLNQWQVRG